MTGRISPRDLVAGLVRVVTTRPVNHPLRVAIDGPDAAGKTTLADAVADQFPAGRSVIRASIDGFHHTQEVRYRRGPLSPEGYYEDSYDYDALRRLLLLPLQPGGDRRYQRAIFDHRIDAIVDADTEPASERAVLLVDGVFLLRPELLSHWDLRVYVIVSPQETLRRALVRDADLLGGRSTVRRRYQYRYLPGQQLYRDLCSPAERADIVIDNENPWRPVIVKWPCEARPSDGLLRAGRI